MLCRVDAGYLCAYMYIKHYILVPLGIENIVEQRLPLVPRVALFCYESLQDTRYVHPSYFSPYLLKSCQRTPINKEIYSEPNWMLPTRKVMGTTRERWDM